MLAIINKLLSLTWLGDIAKVINGNKTLLGFFAILIHMLNVVPTYFPEYGIAVVWAANIQQALLYMGVLLPIGIVHKVTKALAAPKPE